MQAPGLSDVDQELVCRDSSVQGLQTQRELSSHVQASSPVVHQPVLQPSVPRRQEPGPVH
eukprot:115495-Rhodomonas_salina.1